MYFCSLRSTYEVDLQIDVYSFLYVERAYEIEMVFRFFGIAIITCSCFCMTTRLFAEDDDALAMGKKICNGGSACPANAAGNACKNPGKTCKQDEGCGCGEPPGQLGCDCLK